MKALVIGGAGFMACTLPDIFRMAGSPSISLRPDPADRDLNAFLEGADEHKYARTLSGDTRPARWRPWTATTPTSFTLPQCSAWKTLNNAYAVLDVNVRLTVDALRLASKQRNLKQLVFASTSEVYAGTLEHGSLSIPTSKVHFFRAWRNREQATCSVHGEALCEQSGLPCTIIRPHNVYGPRSMRHVIPQLLQRS